MEWLARLNSRIFPNRLALEEGNVWVLHVKPTERSGKYSELKFIVNNEALAEAARRGGVVIAHYGDEAAYEVSAQELQLATNQHEIFAGKRKRGGGYFGCYKKIAIDTFRLLVAKASTPTQPQHEPKGATAMYVMRLKVTTENIGKVIEATKGIATLDGIVDAVEYPKKKGTKKGYRGGVRNKGISGPDLIIKILREANGQPVSLETLREEFTKNNFAPGSVSSMLTKCRRAGKVMNVGSDKVMLAA